MNFCHAGLLIIEDFVYENFQSHNSVLFFQGAVKIYSCRSTSL